MVTHSNVHSNVGLVTHITHIATNAQQQARRNTRHTKHTAHCALHNTHDTTLRQNRHRRLRRTIDMGSKNMGFFSPAMDARRARDSLTRRRAVGSRESIEARRERRADLAGEGTYPRSWFIQPLPSVRE